MKLGWVVTVVVALLVLPATALADKALHGTWKVTSVKAGAREMPSDPKVGVWITFHKTGYEFKVTYGSEVMQKRTGTWSTKGTTLSSKEKGSSDVEQFQFMVTKTTLTTVRADKTKLKTTFKRIVKKR